VALSKHVTSYGRRTGLWYYSIVNPLSKRLSLAATRWRMEQLCGLQSWEPLPIPKTIFQIRQYIVFSIICKLFILKCIKRLFPIVLFFQACSLGSN